MDYEKKKTEGMRNFSETISRLQFIESKSPQFFHQPKSRTIEIPENMKNQWKCTGTDWNKVEEENITYEVPTSDWELPSNRWSVRPNYSNKVRKTKKECREIRIGHC